MRRAAMGLAAMLLLGACVSIPTSGPVEEHSAQAQRANPGVEIAPVPPATGASPTLIVEGFLHAMATYERDFGVARQYLTPEAGAQWQPEGGIAIYREGFPPVVSETGAVLTAPLVGRTDAAGVFTRGEGDLLHDFGLVQDAQQQWRISKPPSGLLVSQYLFASTYSQVNVSFWDRELAMMVPDPRFLPKGQHELEAAVSAVLGGPSAWVAPIARPPFGPALTVESVELSGSGVARIELTPGSLPAADVRERLLGELAWSLAGMDGVVAVRVSSGSTVWPFGTGETASTADFAQANPARPASSSQVFALVKGGLNKVTDVTGTPELAPVAPALTRIDSFAIRRDNTQYAAVTDGRTRVRTVAPGQPTSALALSGRGLLRPQFSRQGELWIGSDEAAESRVTVIAGNKQLPVVLEGVPPGGLRAVRLAPDGLRAVLVVGSERASRIGVARVERTGDGIRVTGWRDLMDVIASTTEPTEFRDAVWSSPTSILLLTSDKQGTQVLSMDSEGLENHDIGPGRAISLSGLTMNPGAPGLAISSDGVVYRLYGEFTWGPIITGVDGVNYPD